MSKEAPNDDPREATDWKNTKQTDEPWKGPVEKERSAADRLPIWKSGMRQIRIEGEANMAVNKPVGDSARKAPSESACRSRSS
jgi:hypothetical protein